MARALEEFGVATVSVKTLITWLKADLGHTNAPIRQAAIAVLTVMHRSMGDKLGDLLRADIKPALMTTVQDQWNESKDTPGPPISRYERKRRVTAEESEPARAAPVGTKAASKGKPPRGTSRQFIAVYCFL